MHELGTREDARVGPQAGERAVEVVDERVLGAVAVHRNAAGGDDPRAMRRRQVREIGARRAIDGNVREEDGRYVVRRLLPSRVVDTIALHERLQHARLAAARSRVEVVEGHARYARLGRQSRSGARRRLGSVDASGPVAAQRAAGLRRDREALRARDRQHDAHLRARRAVGLAGGAADEERVGDSERLQANLVLLRIGADKAPDNALGEVGQPHVADGGRVDLDVAPYGDVDLPQCEVLQWLYRPAHPADAHALHGVRAVVGELVVIPLGHIKAHILRTSACVALHRRRASQHEEAIELFVAESWLLAHGEDGVVPG